MAVILYLPQKERSAEHLLRIIKEAIPDQKIEIISSIDDLSLRLHQPMLNISVAVLYAANRSELMEIICLGGILGELRVILVLPDSNPDVLDKAYILCPRFIAAAESDFKYLGDVLKRMTDLYDKIH